MTDEGETRISELFHEALALDPDRRLAFLNEACAGDIDLFRRVKDLLSSYAEVKTVTPISSTSTSELLDEDTLLALGERYDSINPVGHGGMGAVLRAYDRELDKVVALKVLHPSLTDDQRAIERFRNEIRLAHEITHKNVCRTYGLERINGKLFISMEYVDGETLRAILDQVQGVSVPQGISWTQEICDGLAAAHDKGIIHRDLKPDNIMIDRGGHAKVMDFGIARSIELDRTGATVIGTPQYMSPEQAMGKALSPATDIYSLGLVLYELFSGIRRDPDHPVSPSKANRYLPAHIDAAIERCLAERAASRFQTVHELATAVSHGIDGHPETERLVVIMRRYRLGLFATLVALTIMIALGWVLIRRGSLLAKIRGGKRLSVQPKESKRPRCFSTPSTLCETEVRASQSEPICNAPIDGASTA